MRIRAVVGVVVVLAMWAFAGAAPMSSALAPASSAVYVSNAHDSSVSVIDPATNTVIATVPVGSEPRNLAASPDRSTVYVPNRFDDTVSIIDTDTNTVTNTVTIPPCGDSCFNGPYAVAFTPDGSEAWVVNKKGGGSTTGSVTIISTGSETVTGTIDHACFSSPESIAMNPVTDRAYVVNRGDDSVCVVDTSTKTVVTSVTTGDNPRFAVVLPDGSAVYVTNGGSWIDSIDGNVTRIDTSDNSTTTINTGGNPRNAAMTSDGSTVYVPLQDARIAVIPTATDLPTYISFTGTDIKTYGATVVPGTTLGYVTDEDNDEVAVFDTATNTEVTGTGLPIATDEFTPRAIASLGEAVVPPPTTTTTTTTTTVVNETTTTAAAQPQALVPTFTG